MKRVDGRLADQVRKVKMKKNFLKYALGSCMIEIGNTKVICSASVEDQVPRFIKGTGKGWITAEYGMLPASCTERIIRESSKGKISGRTSEIQRLIGRSMRSIADMEKLGERSIWIDCDVIQGDGGTRTAAITGSFVALADACNKLVKDGKITKNPLRSYIAAVSVGIHGGTPILDLCYAEDSTAEVDMNVVMTEDGRLVEVQGTAEREPFTKKQMDQLLRLAEKGILELIQLQKKQVKLAP